jgi:hypothetical protein
MSEMDLLYAIVVALFDLRFEILVKTYRTESDSMGDKQIPSNVYYGIQTLSALSKISQSAALSLYQHTLMLVF